MAILIPNPLSDEDFVRLAQLLAAQADDAAGLQAELRAHYPKAVVRARGLSSETEAWYVYRDGAWVSR